MTPWTADILRALRENNETAWTSLTVPTHLHEMIVSLYDQNEELRRRVAGADEEIGRLRALATAAMEALIHMCDQYLTEWQYDESGGRVLDGYHHMCMAAGEHVEEFAELYGIRIDSPEWGSFLINPQWRSILQLNDEVQP